MATVNITITATVSQLSSFADELGYLPQIAVGAEADGTTIIGANPQSKQEFLAEYFNKVTVNELARVRVGAIDREIRDQRAADKEAIRKAIASAVAVTVS